MAVSASLNMDPITGFVDAMRSTGIEPPDHVTADGNLHRFASNGKRGDDSGWYVLHLDGIAAGEFGCWRSGIKEKWCVDIGREFTPEEKRAYAKRMESLRRSREAEEQDRHANAARRAAEIWNAAKLGDHAYLNRKGIGAHGVRVHDDGRLVVPMRDSRGDLCSLQFIADDGSKKFLTGGEVKGCYHSIGKPDGVLCVAEGYATAASIHQATGHAVAVAFNAGNLLPVAKSLRAKFPDLKLIMCADNDAATEGNPGMTKATDAAKAVNGALAVPDFGDDDGTDFNDLHQLRGTEAVRQAIAAASEPNLPCEPPQVANSYQSASTDQTIAALAQLDPISYGQRRKEVAKQLGVSVTAVDQAVKRAQRNATDSDSKLLFAEIEPCTDRVNGAEVLAEIAAEIRRYIVLPEHAATAAALWVLHTYAVEAAYIAPILAVQSPQKRCGKSQLLTILNALVNRGLMVANLSLAALYRAMDMYGPTLLIDEADAFLDDFEEMRGIINAGHSRATARTLRVGGENRNELEIFDSFGPKAIAGIGKRQDTIADRSIIVPLRRRLKDEAVEVLRQDRLDYRALQGRCAGWVEQNLDRLRAYDPDMPQLHDRAQDNWRPLIAIADLCGWESEARKAARGLTESDSDESAAAMVLKDIHALFSERSTARLASAEIVEALHKMEERPWPEWKQGKPITQRQLARLLAPFEIKPKLIKFPTGPSRGYALDQFADSFTRYISDSDPLPRYQSHNDAGSSDFFTVTEPEKVTDRSVTATGPVTDKNTLEASNTAKGNGVTDRKPKTDGGNFDQEVTL